MNWTRVGLICVLAMGCQSADAPRPVSQLTEPTALTGGALIQVEHLAAWAKDSYIVVDVRKTDSPEKKMIVGAMPVFLERLGPMYPGLAQHSRDIPVLVVADKDDEALWGAQMLTSAGFKAAGLQGGIDAWVGAGLATEKNISN